MKKIKYYYNTNSLRYEKLVVPLRVKLLRVFGLLSAITVSSALIIWAYTKFFPKAIDKQVQARYDAMEYNYATLNKKVKDLQQKMGDLEKRDNDVYRSIFEAKPVLDSARLVEMEKQKAIEKIQVMGEEALSKSIATSLDNIGARIAYQTKSYDAIAALIKNQDKKLACIPAIQPVSNKDLTRIASGFGMRVHPIYGIAKMHNGLDFTAPQGVPIYATGDGIVTTAGANGGAGNEVIINHGYGYESVYMHMVRIKTSSGAKVKRGEIIGWVGNTGASTGPHCHYEVHINGVPVDPIYFFYNDLSPEQFEQLAKIAATGSAKSFD
jgi:murein DD-endopeptidase MepM/ murein hydrolase activator NlpD